MAYSSGQMPLDVLDPSNCKGNLYCHVPAFGSSRRRDTHLSSCETYEFTCLAFDIDGQLQKERHGDVPDDVLRRAPVALTRSRSFYFDYKTMWTLRSQGLGVEMLTGADVPVRYVKFCILSLQYTSKYY